MKNINIKKGFPVFTENPVVGGQSWIWTKDYESPALTAELMAQISRKIYIIYIEDFA